MVAQVAAAEKQNVDVAGELAMLEAIVQYVSFRLAAFFGILRRFGRCFGEQAGLVAFGGDVDGDVGAARDEQWLVAEFFRCAIGVNQKWTRGTPAVAARKHIDMQAASGEGFGKGDGEWSLPCPAGGEIADADDRPAETADGFEAGAELQLAQRESEPVNRNERPKQRARGRRWSSWPALLTGICYEEFADCGNAAIGGAGLAVEDFPGALAHGFSGCAISKKFDEDRGQIDFCSDA